MNGKHLRSLSRSIGGMQMNVSLITPYLTVIGITGFLIIIAFILIQNYQKKQADNAALGKIKVTEKDNAFDQIAQKAYTWSMNIPGIKRFVLNVRKRLETLAVYDEYYLRREVMKIIFFIVSTLLIIVTLLLCIRPSVVVAFWVLIGMLFITGVLTDFFVHKVEDRLLVRLKAFNTRIRVHYQQTKMVDEAIFESMKYAGVEMKVQAERIHHILTSVEPDKELAKYEEVAPTRFLKVLAGFSLLVKMDGDKFDKENGSVYLRSISAINEELNNDILYRSNLMYRLRSLSALAVIPIFFSLPIKNWAITNFPIAQTFYDSQIGFIIEVFIYVVAVICYLSTRKLRDISEAVQSVKVNKGRWEKWVFKKMPYIENIVRIFAPKPYTKRHFQLQQLIKDANSYLKIDWLIFHQILIGVLIVVMLTSVLVIAHAREKYNTLNHSVPVTLFAGKMTEEDVIVIKQRTAFDKEIIAYMQESKENLTEHQLKQHISLTLKKDITDKEVLLAYNRIIEKWKVIETSYLKWWEFVIVLLIAGVAVYVPILNLRIQRHLRYKEMEVEVHQLLVLISSLREFNHMSVYMIIKWMERFSVVFKEPLTICLQDFDSGPEEALNELMETVPFEPFQHIIERLKLAIVRISIQEAFDDIDMERAFYLEQRKEAQKRSIKLKSDIGVGLGFTPMTILIFAYIVLPLLYMSVKETSDITKYI